MPTIGPTLAPTPSTNFLTHPVSMALSSTHDSSPPENKLKRKAYSLHKVVSLPGQQESGNWHVSC